MLLRAYITNLLISLGFTAGAVMFVPQMASVSPWITVPLFSLPISFAMFVAVTWVMPRMRHRSFMLTVAGQAFVYLAVIILSFSVSLWIFVAVDNEVSPFDAQYMAQFGRVLVSPTVLGTAAVCFVFATIVGAIHQISHKMGPGVLWNWITGRYHEPHNEPRIFMFLDLKDSTTLAEQLGNIRFSALVRDFFADLTGPITKTRGEVSHYIGDEAVLTWRMDRGIRDANCLRCFFLFEDALAKRTEHYRAKYGLMPEFKAGVHCGDVVATEVGEVKSEIVFHGDVLNTTARIQGATGEVGRRFLASQALLDVLGPVPYALEPLGEHLFKGKSEAVAIVGVTRLDDPA